MDRQFYAIEYAYGRSTVNEGGQRADHIHRFSTVAERTRWLDQQARVDIEADPIEATHPKVKKALRYWRQYERMGMEWPVAV